MLKISNLESNPKFGLESNPKFGLEANELFRKKIYHPYPRIGTFTKQYDGNRSEYDDIDYQEQYNMGLPDVNINNNREQKPTPLNINLAVYEYKLGNYRNDENLIISTEFVPYADAEYITKSLGSAAGDKCGLVKVINDDRISSAPNRTRSCDVISSEIEIQKNTDQYINNTTFDENELTLKKQFEISINDKYITSSSDLFKFITKLGAKRSDLAFFMDFAKMTDFGENIYNTDTFWSIAKEMNKVMPDRGGQYVEVLDGDKIYVIFGDFHGSFSTLIRHLARLREKNIIGQQYEINPRYHIIFLGDIVDRGLYSYECVMLLWMLKILSPNNVSLNRGNHEETWTNSSNINMKITFKDELVAKFGDRNGAIIHEKINLIMEKQSSGIIIKNITKPGNDVFLAHGGLPHDSHNLDQLAEDFVKGLQTGETFNISDASAYVMRWNDFYAGDKTMFNKGRGNESDPDSFMILGENILKNASDNRIKFIIRGHQDSDFNTKIIRTNGGDLNLNPIAIETITPHHKNDDITCIGQVYNIKPTVSGNLIINEKYYDDILPVITTSTNTDLGRNLTYDSYVILEFDTNKKQLSCTNSNPSTNEQEILGGSLSKKYHNKYQKYKTKILRLK
jgi:hypothetical protein